jgi:hypothetical protein
MSYGDDITASNGLGSDADEVIGTADYDTDDLDIDDDDDDEDWDEDSE